MGRKTVSDLLTGLAVVFTALLLVAAVLSWRASFVSPEAGNFWASIGLLMPVILLLNLAALLFALRYHLSKRGKHLSDLFKPAPPAPPHVEAIRALEGLHNQKLWQNNKHKAYYSGLTDILRRYLAGRYGIGALEMTSDEIIDAVRPLDLPRKSAMELTALLREADLVKFAKATPEAARNEEAYQWAYYFVEETKPVEEQPSAEAEEPLDLTPKNDSHA